MLALLHLVSITAMEVWLDCRLASGRLPAHAHALCHSRTIDRTLLPVARVLGAELAGMGGLLVVDAGSSAMQLQDATTRALLGAVLTLATPSDQARATALIGSVDWLLVDVPSKSEAEAAPPVFIAAENLLAVSKSTPTRLAMPVRSSADVRGLAFALELGVDALVLPLALAGDDELVEALQIAKAQRAERAPAACDGPAAAAASAGTELSSLALLSSATVTAITAGHVADRVALDFTSLLQSHHGCLVGSSAKALAFVHGETAASGFVPPRPFRCNAGPVHSCARATHPCQLGLATAQLLPLSRCLGPTIR